MPWPSCVTVHLLLARLSTCFESKASSEPSENLALVAMVLMIPENWCSQIFVVVIVVVCCTLRVVIRLWNMFIMILGRFCEEKVVHS